MKHILPALILLSFLLSSCHDYDKSRWEEYQGVGLLADDVFLNTLKFQDASVGYVGGRKVYHTFTSSGDIQTAKDSTVIFKTTDTGRTWEQLDVPFEGNIKKIKIKSDSILALNQYLNTPPSILLSTAKGKVWNKIIAFPMHSYIRDFAFNKGNAVLVALDNKKYLNLLKITNTVDTLKKFSRPHYKVAIGKENVFLINPSRDANSNGIIKYNLTDKTEALLRFPNNYYVHSLFLNDHDQLYITAKDGDGNGKVLVLEEGGFVQIDLGKYSTYSLDQIYVAGKRIIINANKKENMGLLGVTHEVLISDDSGKSWHAENYPYPLIVSPADILEDGGFISYQELGKFQKRK